LETYPQYDVINKKPETQNLNLFFHLNYNTFRIRIGFNSSLAQSAGELWCCKVQ